MTQLPPYQPPEQPQERAIHLARMVLPQDPRPVPPSARLPLDLTHVELPGVLSDREPIARASLALPGQPSRPTVVARGPGNLEVPWDHHPNVPALLLPGPMVEELRWRNRWRVAHFISPSAIGLPFDPEVLVQAAWYALSRLDRRARRADIAELAYLTSQVDVLGYGSWREMRFLQEMRLPDEIERQVRLRLGPQAPLLDPRCLRWIVTELCVAAACDRPVRPPQLDGRAKEILGALFPLLGRSGIPFRKEVYRAVWCLHDGFSLGPGVPEDRDETGMAMLAMTAAHKAGVRLYGDPDTRLMRAAEMWSIDDEDPAIVDRDVTPSVIREDFRRATGLTVPQFHGLALLRAYRLRAIHGGLPDVLPLLGSLEERVAPGRGDAFLQTVQVSMSMTPRQWGRMVLREFERYGIGYEGWGTVPQHTSETVRDQPVLALPKALVPLGYGLLLDRAAELPGVLYAKRRRLSRRKVATRVGHLFEARLRHRIEGLPERFWVATEDQIDEVVERDAQRPDAIIRTVTSNVYLVIEIHASRLHTGIASGNRRTLDKYLKEYLRKRSQSDALIADARSIISRLSGTEHATVAAAVPLVVTDEALPSDPAFERAIRSKDPGGNPRFVCSVEEFELLLDLAEAGWDIAGLVQNWQLHGQGQMLGTFLQAQAEITPLDDTLAERFVEGFISAA